MISGTTKIAVLLSHPSTHLQTPPRFNERCVERGIDMVLVPWDVAPADLTDAWQGLRQIQNLAGVVVTIPHKETVAGLCDTLATEAAAMGVCNVARRFPGGKFLGEMYDGRGFVAGLLKSGHRLKDKTVLLLGAGGAATGIAHALAQAGVSELRIANRTRAKAVILVAAVAARFPALTVTASDPDVAGVDVIINGTSVGMHAADPLPVDLSNMAKGTVVAEVIMSPDVTTLLSTAQERGAKIHKGVHMVDAQIDLLINHLLEIS
ncbi:MAG: shikimate dehydrogenase [Rhizobiaceae bacterium]|nr:shikimate dehydrogenase [Rhizobiaceae bacterium]MBL4732733.1 shikimate dehydrogenase [Rhizobiaceae bacterium]